MSRFVAGCWVGVFLGSIAAPVSAWPAQRSRSVTASRSTSAQRGPSLVGPVRSLRQPVARLRSGGSRRAASRIGSQPIGPAGVLAQVRRIAATVRSSTYTHHANVDPAAGRYDFDCSGLTSWVLERAAPEAQRAVVRSARRYAREHGYRRFDRVRAVNYHERIVASPVDHPAEGWLRIPRVADIEPGDVIVWLRPPTEAQTNPNTGHTLFAMARPEPVAGLDGAYTVRVADSSRRRHDEDSRPDDGRTGFGFGTILLLSNTRTGEPVGFGRMGRRSTELVGSGMAIGRPVH